MRVDGKLVKHTLVLLLNLILNQSRSKWVDAANTVASITNQLCLKRLREGVQLPPTSNEDQGGGPQLPGNKQPKPPKGGQKRDPKVDSDDEDPGEDKRKTWVVHQESDAKAKALWAKLSAVLDDYNDEWNNVVRIDPAPGAVANPPHPINDLVGNQYGFLNSIQTGANWWTNGVKA
ncbi:uncharacterized protein CTRU02_207999 [Colletotrichum truncatum]|uniref:Uncharacterized protein n=1 Tax=Colletotrichum truncatum TaxID=5467 RepID=A0ACC3YV08_COLTU